MPSEDFPPLAPFPELTPAPAPADGGSPAEPPSPSLLSAAQRRELAFAADLLSSRVAPPTEETPPANAADDFLLGGSPEGDLKTDDFSFASELITEEPVAAVVDFLSVPGENGPAAGAADGFSLQSLAASLTVPANEVMAAPLPATSPVPAASSSRKRDDWEPPAIPAFPALTAGADEKPQTVSGSPVALAALVPPTLTTVPVPPPEKQDGFFVTLAPVPLEEPPALFPPSRQTEVEEDFDAPLLFPVPSAGAAGGIETDPHDRALGAILCGALLIIAGLFLACLLPSLAIGADAEAGSADGTGIIRSGHIRGQMCIVAAGAAACLVLGIGAATLRRWAPPLIHAAGWTVLLTVLGEMAVATASMFYLSSNDTPGDAVPGGGTAIFAGAGILGVGLPLLLIALFQRPGVAKLCAQADPRPRWTDTRSIPALMVFIAGFTLAAAALAMAAAGAAFPAFGNLTSGNSSTIAWAGIAVAGLAAGGLAAAGHKLGWWLLMGVSCGLTAAILITCQYHAWEELFHLAAAEPPSLAGSFLAGAAMLPLLLIVLITRRAFADAGH